MGIHTWSKSAALILLVLLSIGHAHAATRKHVSMPSDGQVIGSGNGSSKSGSTLHVPGDGKTEYIPSSYGGGAKGTKLPIKVRYDYSIPRTIKGVSSKLRGGLPGMALTIGMQYMLDQVDGFINDLGEVRIPSVQVVPGGYYWTTSNGTVPGPFNSAVAACDGLWAFRTDYHKTYVQDRVDYAADNLSAYCRMRSLTAAPGTGSANYGRIFRNGNSCPAGSTYNQAVGGCMGQNGSRPATDADYDLMEAAAAAKDSEWLKDRLKEHCEGSIAPDKCYESLRDNTWLEGPSSVTEPGPTTTTTSPAGTTTSTTNTRFDITYGNNYYDYRQTKTTIITKPDGTTETQTETEPETEQPKEQEPEPSFSDSALPQIEPFYDPIYKVGLGGVWSQRMSQIDGTPFVSFMHSFIPSFASSCPAFSLNFNISTWANFGTISFWSLCWVFDFVKVCILVTAMFLCRAVIFGG